MSKSIDVFVKASHSIEEFSSIVSKIIGQQFVKNSSVGWNLFNLNFLGVEISIFDSNFEDDLGIEFSKFDYVVSVTPSRTVSAKISDEWAKYFSLVLAELISKELNMRCIVVDDMQSLLETF